MPPSGFVRSGHITTVLDGELGLVGSVPAVVNPFVVDVWVAFACENEGANGLGSPRTRIPPPRIVTTAREFGHQHGTHLWLLVNDQLFYVGTAVDDEKQTRVTTLPIPQDGGDIYFFAVTTAPGPPRPVMLNCRWRTWGDPTAGPFGQKPQKAAGEGVSSTAEGYEVAGRPPDLSLTDTELEVLHLLGFPPEDPRQSEQVQAHRQFG